MFLINRIFKKLFYNIFVGELDEETSIWMSKPRCGVPDVIHEGSSNRRKRSVNKKGNVYRPSDRFFCEFVWSMLEVTCYFAFLIGSVSRWKKTHLTYRILKYTSQLKKSDVDQEITKAFQMWEEVTEFKFTLAKKEKADIKIR